MPSINVYNHCAYPVKFKSSDTFEAIDAQDKVWKAPEGRLIQAGKMLTVVIDKQYFGVASAEALYDYGNAPKGDITINGEKKKKY